MASKIKYNDIVNDLAMRATEAWVKSNNDIFHGDTWLRGKSLDEHKAAEFKKFKAEIEKRYPFEKVTEEDLFNLENFKDDEARKWLKNTPDSYSPGQKAKSIEASKFLPLLMGVAEPGKSWMEGGSEWLREKGNEMGYDTGTTEGFKEFLDKVGEYQVEFERARNLKDFDEANGPLSYIMYPTLMNEARNAVMTGQGGDVIDPEHPVFNRYGALDLGTNFGIALAPEANLLKSRPILNGFVNSALQGVVEGGRQIGTQAMSKTGQEGSIAPVLASIAAGATRPAMVGTANAAAAQLPGYGPQQFARGISMATRKGDPVAMERETVKRAAEVLNSSRLPAILASDENGFGLEIVGPSVWSRLLDAQKGIKYANALNVPVRYVRGDRPFKQPYIDVEQLLKEYDRPFNLAALSTKEGTRISPRNYSWNGQNIDLAKKGVYIDPAKVKETGANLDGRVLWEDTHDTFRSTFPAKYDAALGDNAYRRAGLKTGQLLGDIGGSFEPALKVNPFDLMEPSKFESKVVENYQDTDWYRKLDDEQKAVVDRAYKKKKKK